MTLSGQTALITGASSGIGAATARELSAAGMNLVLHGRRADRLEALTGELNNAVAISGDITDPAVPQQLLDTATGKFGQLDVVFNNAGILEIAPIEVIDVDRCCEMVRINVEAAYRLALLAVKLFLKAGRGHLVNTSSVLGTKTRPTAGAYAGTKYAIEGLSEGLRMELAGTGVQVSCIEPGLVRTELHRSWDEPAPTKLGIDEPLVPEDIARTVRWLLEQPSHVRIPKLLILPGEHAI
jgi:NADP-dependent 3-hydroxy acid dehydrogenase YdfG